VTSDTRRAGIRWDVVIASVGLAVLIAISMVLYLPSSRIDAPHPLANVEVSSDEKFDYLLKRALNDHFTTKMREDATVSFELLRALPTKTGTSFPKIYAWVVISSDRSGAVPEKGAVVVTARREQPVPGFPSEERPSFWVEVYMSQADMRAAPLKLKEVFPEPVLDEVRARY
jgi:hypothetical protein